MPKLLTRQTPGPTLVRWGKPGAKDAAIRLLDKRPTADGEVRGDVGETTKPAYAGPSVLQ